MATQITMAEILAALKADPTLYDAIERNKADLLRDQPQYVETGKCFQLIEFKTIGSVNGNAARINVLGKKQNRDGTPYTRKSRKPRAEKSDVEQVVPASAISHKRR